MVSWLWRKTTEGRVLGVICKVSYLWRVEKDSAVHEGGETRQEARGVYAHSQQLVKRFGPETRRYVIFQKVTVTSCLFRYLGISKLKFYYVFFNLIKRSNFYTLSFMFSNVFNILLNSFEKSNMFLFKMIDISNFLVNNWMLVLHRTPHITKTERLFVNTDRNIFSWNRNRILTYFLLF